MDRERPHSRLPQQAVPCLRGETEGLGRGAGIPVGRGQQREPLAIEDDIGESVGGDRQADHLGGGCGRGVRRVRG